MYKDALLSGKKEKSEDIITIKVRVIAILTKGSVYNWDGPHQRDSGIADKVLSLSLMVVTTVTVLK